MARFAIEVPDSGYFERLIRCREACPAHTDARGYVQAAARGDWALAYRIARGPNPFASICGRVCGAPCEKACRRGAIDAPVSIRALKRAAAERHGAEATPDLRATLALSTAPGSLDAAPRGKRVAVVGAGVAGLTAAHDLARLGYQVAVFEANATPGGMLTTGVPTFRLPRAVVGCEIAAILGLGVELRCGVRVGTDVTLPELRARGFDAVLLAVGLQKARMLDLPGAGLTGVMGGLDFLADFNAGRPIPAMGRVVVIGGGNVAYDCARSAVRTAGTTSVALVCLEAPHEMPADEVEIAEGDEEGIARRNRRGPVRYLEEAGRLAGLEVRQVSRVFDEQGRFAPEMVPGTEEAIPCDTVLVAVGQAGDTAFAAGLPELELGRGGTVVADRETGRTSIPWLFAAGDAARGPGLFIDAIAHASRAAAAIHVFLEGGTPQARPAARSFAMERARQGLRPDWIELRRVAPPAAEVAARVGDAGVQVERPFDEAVARLQGARCLRCEVETVFDGSRCIQCGGCADVCPTWCLRLATLEEIGLAVPGGEGMGAIIKDEERCIRCAACAERCPTDAIAMERLCGFEPWAPAEPEDQAA